MINVSQACIPFKSFDYIYDFLCKDDYGHFNISQKTQCFPRCNKLLNYYNKDIIQKSSEWFILNRNICKLVIMQDKLKINKEYGNIYAPEEHFFITEVFYNNLKHEIIMTPNLPNNATTFTNWADPHSRYKYKSNKGLKNYNSIHKEEILHLLNSKCLFGRKFNVTCFKNFYIKEYITKIISVKLAV
jgi:hypothetical protein